MWDLPRPGLEPVSPALAGRFSTTAPPGKPKVSSLFVPTHFFMLMTKITSVSPPLCVKCITLWFCCFFLLRESPHQTSTITSRRRLYSSDDGVNEEKLPPLLTMSEAGARSQRVEEKGTTYPTEIPKQDSTTFAKREATLTAEIQLPSKSPVEEQPPASLSSQHSLNTQMESTRVSATLPRSYQKTDAARLTSVVAPRPFGSQSRGISSLPRSYTVNVFLVHLVCSPAQNTGELVQRFELQILDG